MRQRIAGLYAPDSGQVRWNGKAVNESSNDAYRQLFSAVFSDFYLFERILGLQLENLDGQAQQYLKNSSLSTKFR
ncbi:MAG: hypothetical protein WBB18_15155 [Nodosilinea sp.]